MTHHPSRRDHGPRLLLSRGERIAGSVADLDRPHVRDARVPVSVAYWLPDEMLRKGTLPRDLHQAAVRYRDDVELAEGAKDGLAAMTPETRGGFSGRCPTQVALDAQARVRQADAALHSWGRRAIAAAVVGNANAAGLAVVLGLKEAVAPVYLMAQLQLVAREYER